MRAPIPPRRFHVVRTAGTVSAVTSSSTTVLSQEGVRAGSVGTRLICDGAAWVVRESGDGGLFVAALASRCACVRDMCLIVLVGVCVRVRARVATRRVLPEGLFGSFGIVSVLLSAGW